MAPAPAFDLATYVRGDFRFRSCFGREADGLNKSCRCSFSHHPIVVATTDDQIEAVKN